MATGDDIEAMRSALADAADLARRDGPRPESDVLLDTSDLEADAMASLLATLGDAMVRVVRVGADDRSSVLVSIEDGVHKVSVGRAASDRIRPIGGDDVEIERLSVDRDDLDTLAGGRPSSILD